ncbi:hypothetical protein [Tissierella pigra]|nr:hypothetical protein [Tissierella pigra]
MKSFGQISGYNDIFIPAMRRLSPAYVFHLSIYYTYQEVRLINY